MNDYLSYLKKCCEMFHVKLSDHQISQFDEYYHFLIDKNKVMNLTAITEPDDVMLKHFTDSISILSEVNLPEGSSIIDIGTGAGFPGVPLKIVRPDLTITLLDSLNKRILFLNELISKLELTEIETIHGRAEDFAHDPKYREQFDFSVSRAVSNLSALCELSIPFLKTGGSFISYKSGEVEKEAKDSLTASKRVGGSKPVIKHFQLPDSDIERSFVIYKKNSHTPKSYPRKAGTPQKKPL